MLEKMLVVLLLRAVASCQFPSEGNRGRHRRLRESFTEGERRRNQMWHCFPIDKAFLYMLLLFAALPSSVFILCVDFPMAVLLLPQHCNPNLNRLLFLHRSYRQWWIAAAAVENRGKATTKTSLLKKKVHSRILKSLWKLIGIQTPF